MSDLIQFPKKQNDTPKARSPMQALSYVLDAFDTEATRADKIVIVWGHESDEGNEYRFVTGGSDSDMSTIGMLEIAKAMVMEE